MRRLKISPEELHATDRPNEYWAAMAPALIRNGKGEIVAVDADHPAFAEAAKLVGADVTPSPPQTCPRCGQPMQGGCRRRCSVCGYAEGCSG
jgi:hypothetical protein